MPALLLVRQSTSSCRSRVAAAEPLSCWPARRSAHDGSLCSSRIQRTLLAAVQGTACAVARGHASALRARARHRCTATSHAASFVLQLYNRMCGARLRAAGPAEVKAAGDHVGRGARRCACRAQLHAGHGRNAAAPHLRQAVGLLRPGRTRPGGVGTHCWRNHVRGQFCRDTRRRQQCSAPRHPALNPPGTVLVGRCS